MKRALTETFTHFLEGKRIKFDQTKLSKNFKMSIGCWFCLENEEAEHSLVAWKGENCYVALDKVKKNKLKGSY